MTANLAVFGTGSEVGKSTVVSALCRIFRRRGTDVAPFKAQNMSNNSGVTPTGDEIGRAQIVQAEAARVPPHADMNPILLKPSGEQGSQLVRRGRATEHYRAQQYYEKADKLMTVALESYERLAEQYDTVVIEGAGSCAEINLKQRDFANFRLAEAVDAPVILVADIDRGGVFAQVVGTLELLEPQERERVKGVIINRFRGDQSLFAEGRTFLEERTGVPVLGVVPFDEGLDLPSEDSLSLRDRVDEQSDASNGAVRIGVIRLPHISNFTDFEPLESDSSFALEFLEQPSSLSSYDAIILPGTKSVRSDLEWVYSSGWSRRIRSFHTSDGHVIGICGGYQMLGDEVRDPRGVEGEPGETEGFGLLPVSTELKPDKRVFRVQGYWGASDHPVNGYEIHMGVTTHREELPHAVRIHTRNGQNVDIEDGARRPDGRVWGCYVHGLFDSVRLRKWLVEELGGAEAGNDQLDSPTSGLVRRETQYERLADHFGEHLDLSPLEEYLGLTSAQK